MKHFVLLFLLHSFTVSIAKGQKQQQAKEIVAQALMAHTQGKVLQRLKFI